MNKSEIRNSKKTKRDGLSIAEVKDLSLGIINNILQSRIIKDDTKYIFLFAPLGNEPDMFIMHDKIKEMYPGINLCYPRVHEDKINMDFYVVYDIDFLRPGYMNILEPDEMAGSIVKPENIKDSDNSIVFIFPGLCFDEQGRRIGYGGGFYDRYCDRYNIQNTKIIKAGVCYDFQLEKDIGNAACEHDVLMDIIITEKRVIDET